MTIEDIMVTQNLLDIHIGTLITLYCIFNKYSCLLFVRLSVPNKTNNSACNADKN